MKVDANDLGTEDLNRRLKAGMKKGRAEAIKEAGIFSLRELRDKFGDKYSPPIIDGLLRDGETMNLVAPPKVGKSWLTYYFAMCVAQGKPLFDMWPTTPGRVAILDNELHPNTIAARLTKVRTTMLLPKSIEDEIFVIPMRGKLRSIGVKREHDKEEVHDQLEMLIAWLASVKPRLVIIDALYRILPAGISENDNAAIAQVLNRIDEYAATLNGAGLILVHHTSKGSQAGKGVTDVGSGAGSLTRACDSHMVLREHNLDDHYVLQAVTRTFKQPGALVLKRDFPLWHVTDEDATNLAGGTMRQKPPAALTAPDSIADYLPESGEVSQSALVRSVRERDGCSKGAAVEAVKEMFAELETGDKVRKEDGDVGFSEYGIVMRRKNNTVYTRRGE